MALSASQTLLFDPWAGSAWIPVTLIGHDSAPKTFTIALTSPSGATLANTSATITIGYSNDIIFRDGFD